MLERADIMAFLSVCPSVCHTRDTRLNDSTYQNYFVSKNVALSEGVKYILTKYILRHPTEQCF